MAGSDDALWAFALRPWAEIEHLKRRYWATTDMTPAQMLRLADEMRRYSLSVRPDWPDEAERRADLEMHVRMSRRLSLTRNERRP